MNGFLFLDKPAGISSFAAIAIARKRLGIKKAGHTGTLDPFATGLLVTAVGSYTRLIPLLSDMPKEYIAEGVFGGTRDTEDVTGTVTATFDIPAVSADEIRLLLRNRFSGTIIQKPPAYSALKINGTRAYQLARRGVAVDCAPRAATIHAIELLSYERPRFIIRVRASGGTYLRSLVRDIGAALGSGAYTASLRRIAIGNIQVDNAIAPQTVDAQAIRSFRDLFPSATVVTVRDAATRTLLKNGNTHLAAPHSDGRFWYCGENGALLAVVDFTRGEAHYVFVDPDASS